MGLLSLAGLEDLKDPANPIHMNQTINVFFQPILLSFHIPELLDDRINLVHRVVPTQCHRYSTNRPLHPDEYTVNTSIER